MAEWLWKAALNPRRGEFLVYVPRDANESLMRIQDLLAKYKLITPPDESVRTAVCSAIKEILDHEVEKSCVRVRGGVAYLKVSPVVLTELMLQKEKILARVHLLLGKTFPRDLR